MARYKTHNTTPMFLEKMRHHSSPYTGKVLGARIIVFPDVWSPIYDWTGEFMIENMPEVQGGSVLEIGAGTGIVSLFAHFSGARSVVAVDTNPRAVENTLVNFYRHSALTHCITLHSDLFQKVHGKFDLIIFNAPFHGTRPKNMLERSVSDFGYRSLRQFCAQARDHLQPDGRIELGFSSSGDQILLRKLLRRHGHTIEHRIRDVRKGYDCIIYHLR